MNRAELSAELRRRAEAAGSQAALAAEIGVSPQHLGDLLAGKREPGPRLLARLGLVRVVSYEPVARPRAARPRPKERTT